MFLKGNFLGVTPLFGAISIIPSVTSYDTFKFYGGVTGAIFSKIWGRNIIISADEFNDYTYETYLPSWTTETYMMAMFNNSLNAGNIENIVGEVQSWYLYRKESTSTSLEFLKILSSSNITYFDFNVLNTKKYTYYLFVQDATILSSPILTNEETSDYYGWFLIDTDNNRTYHFDINFEGGNKTHVDKYTEHKTNNKVNAFTRGTTFFIEGSINAIISRDNLRTDIQYTNEDLASLAEFVNSERPKLLKSRRGELYNVFTYDYKETLLNKNLGENIYISSFSFKEVGDL